MFWYSFNFWRMVKCLHRDSEYWSCVSKSYRTFWFTGSPTNVEVVPSSFACTLILQACNPPYWFYHPLLCFATCSFHCCYSCASFYQWMQSWTGYTEFTFLSHHTPSRSIRKAANTWNYTTLTLRCWTTHTKPPSGNGSYRFFMSSSQNQN
jgi:hypothetical protein